MMAPADYVLETFEKNVCWPVGRGKGDGVLMKVLEDYFFETFENHRILAPLSKAKDTMERGRSGRKSYVMRFLKTQGNIERGYVDTGSHEAHGRLCS